MDRRRAQAQTGRLTLADARVLVPLLETGDRIDEVIGGRVFRTKSSQDLPRLTLLFEWARAAGLLRAVNGKAVPVKKNAKLLSEPEQLGAVEGDGDRVRLSGTTTRALFSARGGVKADGAVFRLRVTLDDTDPAVWRRVLVPASIRLDQLHGVLQAALGWTDSHLHLFTGGVTRYGWRDPDFDEEIVAEHTVALADIAGLGTVIGYEYDFGDSWEHEILGEDVLATESGVTYPRCVDGAAACPPEERGGTWGYRDLRETLRIRTPRTVRRCWTGSVSKTSAGSTRKPSTRTPRTGGSPLTGSSAVASEHRRDTSGYPSRGTAT